MSEGFAISARTPDVGRGGGQRRPGEWGESPAQPRNTVQFDLRDAVNDGCRSRLAPAAPSNALRDLQMLGTGPSMTARKGRLALARGAPGACEASRRVRV